MAMMAALLASGAMAAHAVESPRGACRVVPDIGAGHVIEMIDLGSDVRRIALRRNGEFLRMLDGSIAEEKTFGGPDGWAIRVYPEGGDRYELACIPGERGANQTFCTATLSTADARRVDLYFPDLDAKRVQVRRNDVWQATVVGEDRWVDSSPAEGASYVLRVKQFDGDRIDIPCREVGLGLYEIHDDGTRQWPVALREPIEVDDEPTPTFDADRYPELDGGSYWTAISEDGTTAAVLDTDEPWTRALYRVDLDGTDVQLIKTNVSTFAISADGSAIAYTFRGKLRVWQLDETAAGGATDRSVVADDSVRSLEFFGDDHLVFVSRADDERYRYTVSTGALVPIGDLSLADDGRTAVDPATGELVDVDTGERRTLFDPAPASDFERVVMSTDGTTVVISYPWFSEDRFNEIRLIDVGSGDVREFRSIGRWSDGNVDINRDASVLTLTTDEGELPLIVDLRSFSAAYPDASLVTYL